MSFGATCRETDRSSQTSTRPARFWSRIVVTLDWLWAYVTFRHGAGIILAETGRAGDVGSGS